MGGGRSYRDQTTTDDRILHQRYRTRIAFQQCTLHILRTRAFCLARLPSSREERTLMAQSSTPPSTSSSPSPKIVEEPLTVTAPKVVNIKDTAVAPEKGPEFIIHSNTSMTRYLKALVYADYGVGKTYLTGTSVEVPQMRDVLMVSAEAGELTLYNPDSHIPFHLIDIVHVQDYHTTARVHEFLKVHCSLREQAEAGYEDARARLLRLQHRLMPGIPDEERLRLYKTVIIDSLTEVESMCMQQLLGVDASTLIDDELNPESWDEYRKQRQMIHRLIRGFRNLPMNSLFTCPRHFREIQEGTAKRQKYIPMMTGKLSNEVQGFMDLVGHYIAGNPEMPEPDSDGNIPDVQVPRRMYIQPGPRHAAKSRFSIYRKPYFDDPTMMSIMTSVGLLTNQEKEEEQKNGE